MTETAPPPPAADRPTSAGTKDGRRSRGSSSPPGPPRAPALRPRHDSQGELRPRPSTAFAPLGPGPGHSGEAQPRPPLRATPRAGVAGPPALGGGRRRDRSATGRRSPRARLCLARRPPPPQLARASLPDSPSRERPGGSASGCHCGRRLRPRARQRPPRWAAPPRRGEKRPPPPLPARRSSRRRARRLGRGSRKLRPARPPRRPRAPITGALARSPARRRAAPAAPSATTPAWAAPSGRSRIPALPAGSRTAFGGRRRGPAARLLPGPGDTRAARPCAFRPGGGESRRLARSRGPAAFTRAASAAGCPWRRLCRPALCLRPGRAPSPPPEMPQPVSVSVAGTGGSPVLRARALRRFAA
ncbi:basic salivary proline-rich protein 2-like [Varanus komodoensis]|uniref:basic salivary proline-rich protein 2-like n=1 Tax=Varanus komodoensis TaxID=61221 RepID=UPI001CF7BD72|nr:basic salivary proline-rich protein 2-like [Varanus komodoensis]